MGKDTIPHKYSSICDGVSGLEKLSGAESYLQGARRKGVSP